MPGCIELHSIVLHAFLHCSITSKPIAEGLQTLNYSFMKAVGCIEPQNGERHITTLHAVIVLEDFECFACCFDEGIFSGRLKL